jgi:hypothetical protein
MCFKTQRSGYTPQLDALWQASCEITLLVCRAAIPEGGGQQSPAQLFLRPQHQQEKLLTRRRRCELFCEGD